VNAALYPNGRLDIEKTPWGKDFGSLSTYANSKLCNILFTRKFSEMIQGSGVTINAIHPGIIRTDLAVTKSILGSIIKFFKVITMDSPETGAKPPVWLAADPELENINGAYFDRFVRKTYAKNAENREAAEKLWDLSMRLAAL
jgi:NAD(P)-dependent dehydrogenase (short-subunit alcohol dehydrogenase family)